MKVSETTQKALELLYKWSRKKEVYDFYDLNDIEFGREFEEFEYLDEWFGFDFKSEYEDRFLEFGRTPTGGVLALWFYPKLDQEPPVVYIGDEGETHTIASCMEDFVCLFTQGKTIGLSTHDEDRTSENIWNPLYRFEVEDLAEKHNTTTEKIKIKLDKSIEKFQKFVSKKITCSDTDTIFENLKKHPDFIKWVDDIRNKHEEEILAEDEEDTSSLYLAYENLTEVPESVLENLEITSLDLSNNEITELPEFLSQLTKLEKIYLEDNQITKVPKFFENFEHLEKLSLQRNRLSKLKLDFTKMNSLEFLYVEENSDFSHIDESIFQSTSLITLDYNDTLLEKEINPLEFIEKFSSEMILDEVDDIVAELDEDDISEKDKELIVKIIEKRVKLYPTSENYYKIAQIYHYSFNEYKKAERYYMECYKYKDDDAFEASMLTDYAKLYYYRLESDFDKAEELFKEAISLEGDCEYCLDQYATFVKYEREDYDEVAKIYKKLITLDDEYVSYYEQYAELLNDDLKKHKKALKVYKKLYKLTDKKRYLKKYAEILAFDLYDYEKALPIFKKLLKKKQSADNYFNYILVLQNSNVPQELITEVINRAYEKHPKDEYILAEYKANMLENNDHSLVEKSIEDNSALERDYVFYAKKLSEEKQNSKAKEVLEKGLKNFPDSPMLMAYLLHILTQINDNNEEIVNLANKLLNITDQEAIVKLCEMTIASRSETFEDLSAYDSFIASKNGDISELSKECASAFVEKDFKKVLAIIKAIEKIDAYHAEMLSMYVSFFSITQNIDSAIEFLKEKIKTAPNSNPYTALADIYIKQNDEKKLKALLQEANEKFPDDENLSNYNDYIEEPKVVAQSEEEFEELLEKEPKNVEYLRAFADYLFDKNKFSKAIKYYKKVVEIDKDDFSVYFDMSQAYFLIGDREKEETYKIKALELNPMQLLNFILKTNPLEFKKYAQIAQEKFSDNKEMSEFIAMYHKLMA